MSDFAPPEVPRASTGIEVYEISAENLVPGPGAEQVLFRTADPDKLRQILVNLLSNAVKFTEPDGEISLECRREGECVFFSVRDSGIGIAADQVAAVFEPFVQVRSDLTRTQEGTGLGLAISRQLARGMGGNLVVQSTPGVGSAFTLELPD